MAIFRPASLRRASCCMGMKIERLCPNRITPSGYTDRRTSFGAGRATRSTFALSLRLHRAVYPLCAVLARGRGRGGMDTSLTLIGLAGSIALLLWGVHMVQSGIQRGFGPHLRRFLGRTLRRRFPAFLAGLGVTAVLQSSTATGLMAASFAAGGLVDLVPALAVMLGANVGTTLIVQLLSFNIARVAPLFVLVGVILFRRSFASRTRDLGRVAIGLGLMLFALQLLLSMLTPFEDVPSLRLLMGTIATQPIIDVIIAAAMTWAAHSSVATVLLTMSLAAQGVVPPHAALALVLGANLGTALNPLPRGSSPISTPRSILSWQQYFCRCCNRSPGCWCGCCRRARCRPTRQSRSTWM